MKKISPPYMDSFRQAFDEIRAELNELEKKIFEKRPLPSHHWEVGHVVRYLRDAKWAFNRGDLGMITGFSLWDKSDKGSFGHKPPEAKQIFYTSPIIFENDKGVVHEELARWRTTPDDVELVDRVSINVVWPKKPNEKT